MAASPIYLRLLERMIERLRDPYKLSAAEQAKLESFLDADDRVAFSIKHAEIRAGNDLMRMVAWKKEHDPYFYPEAARLLDAINERALCPYTVQNFGRVERRTAKVAKLKARPRPTSHNPHVLANWEWDIREAERLVEIAQSWTDDWVNRVRRAYESLPPIPARMWEHRGEWNRYNLPSQTDLDRVIWPNHPNADRQAYIEVLTEKLDRLKP